MTVVWGRVWCCPPGWLQLSLCLSKANDPAVLAGTGMEGRTCVLLARVKVSVDEPLALEPELADRFNRDGVIYLPWGREWRQRCVGVRGIICRILFGEVFTI